MHLIYNFSIRLYAFAILLASFFNSKARLWIKGRKNWKENIIPTVVLSSATLPKENELTETIPDFLNKFPGAEICNIISHDCKKSIPLINKDGFVVLPHHLNEDYNEVLKIAKHCQEHLTLLRYFD